MLSLPGGLGQRVHRDGPQPNLALMVALEDGTAQTRFLDAQTISGYKGGRELELLACDKVWTDLPAGRPLRTGECILFSTLWWHAGPAQAHDAGFRRVIFFPLTGGSKDRRGQTEFVARPKRQRSS